MDKEPEFLRKERIRLSKTLKTKIVPSKKLHNRKKDHGTEQSDT